LFHRSFDKKDFIFYRVYKKKYIFNSAFLYQSVDGYLSRGSVLKQTPGLRCAFHGYPLRERGGGKSLTILLLKLPTKIVNLPHSTSCYPCALIKIR